MARKQGSHSDITGPRVHETALRLIARHGFAAVSMRQIASEVGVQAGTLYNYIPDKQTLLFDLMRGHLDDLLAACPDATAFALMWQMFGNDGRIEIEPAPTAMKLVKRGGRPAELRGSRPGDPAARAGLLSSRPIMATLRRFLCAWALSNRAPSLF